MENIISLYAYNEMIILIIKLKESRKSYYREVYFKMSEVLILKLDLDPEVEIYMDNEGVSFEKAIKSLDLYPYEASSAELEVVDKSDLISCGIKGRDYLLVKKLNTLEAFEYELEDVLNELNLDIKGLKRLGVAIDESDDYEDE
jgi:hypothetical protein